MTKTEKMLALEVEVPIASFRQSRAREYAETYPVPPPSTVYGMLLSIVGEIDRYKHCGIRLAIALISQPQKSTVIRTFRRFKKKDIHDPSNARPDYQELLTDIKFITWVDAGQDNSQPTLPERLQIAFANPASINRFGGLCLGESRDLVNAVTLLPKNYQSQSLQWLVCDENGLLTLPYWVDHVGSKGTRWQRYIILEPSEISHPPEAAWTLIQAT
ncbi:type I-MYXAN CRISPR-associated protein Cas5/Cmx5/DevS [Nostoc sp. CENA67]|uniref:Type I-MYXAN CRISPR-associated protein Cas5/Cmx5/DevS n=1 Tax=Amazonocrinis nigriterrae CENA67 TaxID=2794033 RepID=A0A8J7HNK9_9NOST|nr:type I-MYXAN CRISPR-associated protein Cas5/Cmx5/DevS [Amazonocrinis nigriterrae]MBH8562647.1 type I-MYXAN CRISPR-associated protein Cas5/Cmx5/DevS [Amazonocrinis nigriterrae CENA67]